MSTKNIIVSLLVIIVIVLFYTWQRMEVLKISYEIDKLRNEKDELINKNKFLQVEVASLKSLDRVEKTSRHELGLVTPDKFEMISLEGEDSIEDERIKNNRYGLVGINAKKEYSIESKGADKLE